MSSSPKAVEANSRTSNGSIGSASPKGFFTIRAAGAFQKRAQLLESYKKLFRIFKILELHYQRGAMKKLMLTSATKNVLDESKAAFAKIPRLHSEMNFSDLEKIVQKQRQRVINGVLKGLNQNFKNKAIEITQKAKEEKDIQKDLKEYKKMRNELLNKHKNSIQMKDAKAFMNAELKQMIDGSIRELKRYEATTNKYRRIHEEKERAKSARKQATKDRQAAKKELNAAKKVIKYFIAKKRRRKAQVERNEAKARQKSKEKKDKMTEKEAREKAREAEYKEKEARRVAREDKRVVVAAEKEAKRAQREEKKAMKAELDAQKASNRAAKDALKAAKKAQNHVQRFLLQKKL